MTETELLLDSFWTLFKISAPVIIVVILIIVIIQKLTGGRGLLYKFIQDYGYDHAYTIGALKNVVDKILTKEGYGYTNLSIGHEVGNRYFGEFYDTDKGDKHNITVITDGSTVDYKIDLEPTKRYTK